MSPSDHAPDAAREPSRTLDASSPTLILVRRAMEGDREALAALYDRHHDRVRRYAALRMRVTYRRCEHSIEDVAQEVWTQAMDALLAGRFDPDRAPGAFRRWLAALVANRARDRGRKAARSSGEAVASPSEIASTGPGQATQAGRQEMFERVESALVVLDEQEREAVCLRHLCGMSSDEIRAELGLARSEQARWLVARGMRRLRSRLGRLADEWAQHYD